MTIRTFMNSTDAIRTVMDITDICGDVIGSVNIIRKCVCVTGDIICSKDKHML